jgi:hypothetical protein
MKTHEQYDDSQVIMFCIKCADLHCTSKIAFTKYDIVKHSSRVEPKIKNFVND